MLYLTINSTPKRPACTLLQTPDPMSPITLNTTEQSLICRTYVSDLTDRILRGTRFANEKDANRVGKIIAQIRNGTYTVRLVNEPGATFYVVEVFDRFGPLRNGNRFVILPPA